MNAFEPTAVPTAYLDREIAIAALITYVVVATVLTFYVVYQRRWIRQDQRRLRAFREEANRLLDELGQMRQQSSLTFARVRHLEIELAALKLDRSDEQMVVSRPPQTHSTQIHIFQPSAAQPKKLPLATEPRLSEAPAAEIPFRELPDNETPDDLTKIWGIGPGNQQKLQEHGVFYLRQIANWDADQVEHFNAVLAFKGRIQREHWVEQARAILAKRAA